MQFVERFLIVGMGFIGQQTDDQFVSLVAHAPLREVVRRGSVRVILGKKVGSPLGGSNGEQGTEGFAWQFG